MIQTLFDQCLAEEDS